MDVARLSRASYSGADFNKHRIRKPHHGYAGNAQWKRLEAHQIVFLRAVNFGRGDWF